MKRMIICSIALSMLVFGLGGCAEESSTKSSTTVTTPGGETTVTTEKEVKKTGENPPSVPPK